MPATLRRRLPVRPTSLERRIKDAHGPVELAPISNVPITVKLTEDSKVIYQTIGQIGRNQRSVRSRLHFAAH